MANNTSSTVSSTVKHTPGPWEAHDDDGTGTLPCVLSDKVTAFGNFYVAQCNVYDDARLIAAAPELLAALESTIPALMRLGDFVGNVDEGGASGLGRIDRCALIGSVRAALARAKGE